MDFSQLQSALDQTPLAQESGYLTHAVGTSLRAVVPGARVGDLVHIESEGNALLPAEITGFTRDEVYLAPLGSSQGIAPRDKVHALRRSFSIKVSDTMLGRVLDGLGSPIDGQGLLGAQKGKVEQLVSAKAPHPLLRPRIDKAMRTGVRTIDGLCTLGQGQRIGLFAGSGVGKSSLLGQIARASDADVAVLCLVGERGREVREFLETTLGEEGLRKSVVVCATSDAPALVRMKSAFVATTIAEHFRDQGKHVLLLVDSLTRFVRAAREVALAGGEMPARRGYPASAFSCLPSLLERAGTTPSGSITGIYTVLVEGEDLDEPVSDEVRGLLDGHIVLSRALAHRGRYPAIDPTRSLSRVMVQITEKEHQEAARKFRAHIAAYEEKRDLVVLGAYKPGSDKQLDDALRRLETLEAFLRQGMQESSSWSETQRQLIQAVG